MAIKLPKPRAHTQFLPTRSVLERYEITTMTLWRWCQSKQLSFPAPMMIGRRKYWKLADLEAWERQRAKGAA